MPVSSGHISSMRLIYTAEEMPVKGMVTSELVMTFKTADTYPPNAPVTVTAVNNDGSQLSFAVHYISRISRKGDMLTIRAFDKLRRTENLFDDSLYNEEDQPFNTTLLISDLAQQCGFEGTKSIPLSFTGFYFRDIHGKTCREILEFVSRSCVGVWYCGNDEKLGFTSFLGSSAQMTVPQGHSPVYLHSVKGPFKAIYTRNSLNGEVFGAGDSSADFPCILKLSGELFDNNLTTSIMSGIAQKSYQAFYCAHIPLAGAPEGITEFYFPNRTDGLISCKTEVIFGGAYIYAQARAADICEDESDYISLTGYELRKRIEQYREYGSTVMTDRGIGIVADTPEPDPRVKAVYHFSRVIDNVTDFDGAILDKTMPDRIERLSETSSKIVYQNSAYLLSYDKDENGKKTNIKFTKESS